VRGEFTKTRTDRVVYLTEELTKQLTSWLTHKYRSRRVCYNDKQTGKTITEIRTPEKKDTDLIFAVHQNNATYPKNLYFGMVKHFEKTLDSMGKGNREDGSNGIRREITLHSFRRFAKTLNGSSDILAAHIGAKRSRKKPSYSKRLNPI
jgi:hypothetical protein